MAFAGLLVSLGILAITWVVVTLAECGVTIGMILSLPFLPLIEWICNKMDKRTDEEILQDAMKRASRCGYNYKTYEETVDEVMRKYGYK